MTESSEGKLHSENVMGCTVARNEFRPVHKNRLFNIYTSIVMNNGVSHGGLRCDRFLVYCCYLYLVWDWRPLVVITM